MKVQRLRHDLPCDNCGRKTSGTLSLYKNTNKAILCFRCEGGHPSGAGLGIDWVE